MTEWMQPLLIGLAAVAVVFPILVFAVRRRPAVAVDADDAPPELVLGPATEAFAAQMPMSDGSRREVERLLLAAGYYHRSALVEYRAVRTVLAVVPLLVAGMLALAAPDDLTTTRVLIAGAILAALGYSLPRAWVGHRARQRGREIARGLPLAIDLLSLCLSGGQNLLAALRQVAAELQFSHPALAQELAIVSRQAELHSLNVALTEWADRAQTPEVNNLALLLQQSERLGTDTAATLAELAANFRLNMRQRAEAAANRASFWMLFPSVFCFWVAAAILLIGPAYLEYFGYRTRTAELFNQTRTNIGRANEQDRRITPNLPPRPARPVRPTP